MWLNQQTLNIRQNGQGTVDSRHRTPTQVKENTSRNRQRTPDIKDTTPPPHPPPKQKQKTKQA